MVISVCSLAVPGRPRARRAAGRVRLGRADRAARHGAARRGRTASRRSSPRRASPIDDVRGTAAYRRHALARPRAPRARAVPRMRIELTVNGERREADVWGGESLLFALREQLGLPGSKNACEQGECGSCSVLLDGDARLLVPRARRAGRRPRGGRRSRASPRGRRAAPRAGGVRRRRRRPVRVLHARASIVATADLLERSPSPTDDEIREALSGNLCRCTGYQKIFDAVRAGGAA